MISRSKRIAKYNQLFHEGVEPIFNPLYWHISEYLNNKDIRYIYIYGGSSAAKTYSVMQALSIESYLMAYNCYVMRKYSNGMRDTIYSDFKGFNEKLKKRFEDLVIIQNEIRSKTNLIRFRGIDDSEKLKGLSGFTKVFLDEITEFVYDDLKQVRKRLRGRTSQQIILSWNPVSIHHWVKRRVIDKENWRTLPNALDGLPFSELSENSFVKINEKGNAILIKTTYLDNQWVVGAKFGRSGGFYDKHVIADFEDDKVNDENNYNIYALGEWGIPSEGIIFKFKKHWQLYETLPDLEFYETYGLDFGGGGNDTDEAQGSSKTVFVRLLINKATMSIYVKLLVYKGDVRIEELADTVVKHTFEQNGKYINKKMVLADDARGDLITELLHRKINVIGAKSKEGGNRKVVSGYEILKKYTIFVHEDDKPVQIELNNHKWAVARATGEPTGQPEDKYKDVLDAIRYAAVNYDLYNF